MITYKLQPKFSKRRNESSVSAARSYYTQFSTLFTQKIERFFFFWCERRDSNPHPYRGWILSPLCMPFHHPRIFTFHGSPSRIRTRNKKTWWSQRESNPQNLPFEDSMYALFHHRTISFFIMPSNMAIRTSYFTFTYFFQYRFPTVTPHHHHANALFLISANMVKLQNNWIVFSAITTSFIR